MQRSNAPTCNWESHTFGIEHAKVTYRKKYICSPLKQVMCQVFAAKVCSWESHTFAKGREGSHSSPQLQSGGGCHVEVGLPTVCLTAFQQLWNSSHPHERKLNMCDQMVCRPHPVFVFPREVVGTYHPWGWKLYFSSWNRKPAVSSLHSDWFPRPRSIELEKWEGFLKVAPLLPPSPNHK